MSRYIDDDEALKTIKKMLYETALNNFTTDRKFADDCEEIAEHRLATWVSLVPTADAVEVVRCCDADKGDCMFNHWHETPNGEKYHICNLNKLSFSEHADFFCKYGERREDEIQGKK